MPVRPFYPRRPPKSLFILAAVFFCALFLLTNLQMVLFSPCSLNSELATDNLTFRPTKREYYNSPLRQQAMRPFDEDSPKYILVLSYQRSGSSFFGQLFNKNRNIHFLYEPLDSVYVALYGTPEGWNVPTDIGNYWNGSERVLPEFEAETVASTLHDLFVCDHNNLATEVLIHRFWKQFASHQMASVKMSSCVSRSKVTLQKCRQDFKKTICGSRFGDPAFTDKCHRLIEEAKLHWGGNDTNIANQEKLESELRRMKQNKTNNNPGLTKNETKVFPPSKKVGSHRTPRRRFGALEKQENLDSDLLILMKYHKCLDDSRTKIESCQNIFTKQCKSTPVRAIKTVRATMESAMALLERLPNMRVIHLLRDPRAVVVSRSEFDGSASGYYAGKPMDFGKEAMMLCRQMVRDIKLRQRLEQLYPGQIMEIIYDDFVLQPLQYTQLIYKFANITLPKTLKAWVDKQTSGRSDKTKNSTYIATKWQEKMTYRVTKEVTNECNMFFNYVKYEWPE